MKKIIAIILSFAMIFSLTACGEKNSNKKDPITEPTVQVTEPIADEQDEQINIDGSGEESEEEIGDEATDDHDSKQTMWESIFKEGAFSLFSNSFEMNMNDMIFIKVLTDEEGKSLFNIYGEAEGVSVNSTLYQKDSENVYFHMVSKNDDEEIDEWYLCEISDESDSEAIENTMSDENFFGDVKESLKIIEKVEYKSSIDGIDLVDIFCKQENESEEAESSIENELITMQAEIDPETHVIKGLTTTSDGVTASIKFIECSDVSDFITIPDNIEKTITEEDAAMAFAMSMFALAFSDAETAE